MHISRFGCVPYGRTSDFFVMKFFFLARILLIRFHLKYIFHFSIFTIVTQKFYGGGAFFPPNRPPPMIERATLTTFLRHVLGFAFWGGEVIPT